MDRSRENPNGETVNVRTSVSGAADKSESAGPAGQLEVGIGQVADAALSAWKPREPVVALGLAVAYLRTKPTFARLAFGTWSQVLVGQIKSGNFFFVMDQHRRIHGFLGWALTDEALAEEWLNGRSTLREEDCRFGDSVIISAWAAESLHANRVILETARGLFAKKRAFYFVREYPDGRRRPMRLGHSFVPNHTVRAAARMEHH
jgi:hemolysin-activating ACP:hemolysin acyltransferase